MKELIALLPALLMLLALAPLWRLLKRVWRAGVALLLASCVAGCGTTVSNKLEKSPCACVFEPANTGNFMEDDDA